MNLPSPRRVHQLICLLWATTLLVAFVSLAARALAPSVHLIFLDHSAGDGQLTVFNDKPKGGFDGLPIELGDYDGDGNVDVAVAPMKATVDVGEIRVDAGEVYVYPGNRDIQGILNRADLDPQRRGLTLLGARSGDYLGTELFTADVNGDGTDDLLVAAQNHDGPAGGRDNCGALFVVLGGRGLLEGTRTIDLAADPAELRAQGVVTVLGAEAGGRFGIWVEAGDLDGDGRADTIVGSDQSPADTNDPRWHAGKVFVIYGREDFPAVMDLATSSDGVSVIVGKDSEDHLGSCLHARDLNQDGHDDLIISAALNRLSSKFAGESRFEAHGSRAGDGPGNQRRDAGEVHVLFPAADGTRLPPVVDLAAPLPPPLAGRLTTIYGATVEATAGEEVTTGDFNGDGFPDLVVGALKGGESNRGTAHVIYWQAGLEGTTIDLSADPNTPLPEGLAISTLTGLFPSDILGDTLAAADFDHDGLDDLAVGLPHWDPEPEQDLQDDRGAVAVVFGRPDPFPSSWVPQADQLPERIRVTFVIGEQPMDLLSYSMEARDYDSDGYADLFTNAMRGDAPGTPSANDAGKVHLVSGFHVSQAALRLSGVSPRVGCFGKTTPVVIEGNGFTTDDETRVFLGAQEIAGIRVVNARRIEAEFPPGGSPEALEVSVMNRYGTARMPDAFRHIDGVTFLRSDSNFDGKLDITDPIHSLLVLFVGFPFLCRDASDANDDGKVDLSDPIYALEFLFRGGSPPPAPFPAPGSDPSADPLDCCP